MINIAMTGTNGRAKKRIWATLVALATLALGAALTAPAADAQGSRKDDVVFGPGGHPVAGATVTVCQSTATGTPCSPLATVYTDATLTVPAPNPFQTDGIGNYHFYASAGRYVVQISGPGISGTITYRDVILAPDVSSSGSGNNISAFGLTLGGNLSVAGNATINGALTAGSFAPTSLSVAGNETVAGPRPRVDVTAYGAKGDGSNDDTAAIQAAINVACGNPLGGGAVTFPPPTGSGYVIVQPQAPNNSTIFTIPAGCHGAGNGISIVGGSGNWNQITNGGGLPPMININASCGANPGLGPIFLFDSSESVYLENISLTGCNQAVQVNGTVNGATWRFHNVNMGIHTVTGGTLCTGVACTTDQVPFANYNAIEGIWDGGALQNGAAYNAGAVGPTILIAEVNGSSGNGSGLITFKDLRLAGGGSGGGVVADTRCNNGCSAAQNLHFMDIETEAAGSTPFLTVQAENSTTNSVGSIYLERVGASDNNPGTPCISLSGANYYNDITITESQCSGTSGPAIVVQSGTILGCLIFGNQFSGHSALKADGTIAQGCTWQTSTGLDYVSNISALTGTNLGTNAVNSSGFFGNTLSCPIGMAKVGDTNRSLCVDPFFGWGFGPGGASGSGYDVRGYRNGNQSFALMIAQADGPTVPTATLASGGSLTIGTYPITSITNINGSVEEVYCASGCYVSLGQSVTINSNSNSNLNITVTVSAVKGPNVWDFVTGGTPGNGTGGTVPSSYWYYIESTVLASNCTASNLTGPSKEVNAAPVSGSQTVNLAWTAGVGSAAGYCVWRGTSPGAENVYNYVSGQSTTSLSDTGSLTFTSGTPSAVNQTFPANPQFTWQSLSSFTAAFTHADTANRTYVFPDATITVSGAVAQDCGTTTTCSATNISATLKIVKGSVALSSGTPSTATVTGFSAAFTSSSGFVCTATNATTQANPVKVVNASASSITITGPNTVTDTVNYICAGN